MSDRLTQAVAVPAACALLRRAGLALLLTVGIALPAAAEFRSAASAAVLYDAPSQQAKKKFVVLPGTPLEVVVTVGAWVKVRDADGAILWIERTALAESRKVMVRAAKAAVRRAAGENAPVLFEAERDVLFELLDAGAEGWSRVRHADGSVGYVRRSELWGL